MGYPQIIHLGIPMYGKTPYLENFLVEYEREWNLHGLSSWIAGREISVKKRKKVENASRFMADVTRMCHRGISPRRPGDFLWGDQNHFFNGQINYVFLWAIFHSYVTNYKSVTNGISWYIPISW